MYQSNQVRDLEGNPFPLTGRGRVPAPPTLAAALSPSQPPPREQYPRYCSTAGTVARQPPSLLLHDPLNPTTLITGKVF